MIFRDKKLRDKIQRLEWRVEQAEKRNENSVEHLNNYYGPWCKQLDEAVASCQSKEITIDGGHKVNVESLLMVLARNALICLNVGEETS